MSDFLDTMAASSAERAAALPAAFASAQLDKPVFPLQLQSFDVIAEIKDRSPSQGVLAGANALRGEQAERYIKGGAAAISVLTEPSRFAGEIAHLEEVVEIASTHRVPVMRKDFLVSASQVLEAKVAGASGVLLIVAMLSEKVLEELLAVSYEHGLFVLLESFDDSDLQRTQKLLQTPLHLLQAQSGKLLVGVNTRNLRTLAVDPMRLETLAPLLPQNAVCVAESGLRSAADAAAAIDKGYQMALVGTALMLDDDPAALIAGMLDAGRQQASS
jgi:indole-3-glycerol phosphate synthase